MMLTSRNNSAAVLLVLASLIATAAGQNGQFAENTCIDAEELPQDKTGLPGGQVRCCSGEYGVGAPTTPTKWGSCDTSSCVENFGEKNRNCFNYGSSQHPIADYGNLTPEELDEAAGKQQGGAHICPYLKRDKAICDTSVYTTQNGGKNCRQNQADNHCLGQVKCGSTGVVEGTEWNAHSSGTDSEADISTGVECSDPDWTNALCFYDGTSENWKVCKGVADMPCDFPHLTCGGGSFGDPHVRTWAGEHFEYMGECDLVLVDSREFASGLGFTAHIRTKAKGDYSYIEAASIKIGDDTLEVGSYGEYFFKGVNEADMTDAKLGGYPVEYVEKNKKEHLFHINLGEAGIVTLKSYTYLVSIKFDQVNDEGFSDSVGLMGDYFEGKHLARDGKTVVTDVNEYGQEWQVLPTEPQLFDSPAPAGKCLLPDQVAMEAQQKKRRLGEGIPVSAAEAACAHLQKGLGFEECVQDVITIGDLDAANAGAF